MTDTVKTKSQLLTVDFVANAGTEAIGSQQFRNATVSAFGCCGGLYIDAGSTQFTLVASTYQTVLPWTGSQSSSDLTLSTSNGTITIPADSGTASYAGIYLLNFNITVQRDTFATTSATYTKKIFARLANGTTSGASSYLTTSTSIETATEFSQLSGQVITTLAASAVVTLQLMHVNGGTATVPYAAFSAKRIG